MLTSDNHPVWEVYDLHRTARLNVLYYEIKLARYELANTILEVLVAILAPSSAAAGFLFFKHTEGKEVWATLCAFSSTLALVKPFLKLTEKIKTIEKSVTSYKIMDYDLRKICKKIRDEKNYTPQCKKLFDEIDGRLKDLAIHAPRIGRDDKLRDKLFDKVIVEMPKSSFFIPEIKE